MKELWKEYVEVPCVITMYLLSGYSLNCWNAELLNFGQLLISCSIQSQLSEISEIQQLQQFNSLENTLDILLEKYKKPLW